MTNLRGFDICQTRRAMELTIAEQPLAARCARCPVSLGRVLGLTKERWQSVTELM